MRDLNGETPEKIYNPDKNIDYICLMLQNYGNIINIKELVVLF